MDSGVVVAAGSASAAMGISGSGTTRWFCESWMLVQEWCSLVAAWHVGEDGGCSSGELQRWSEVAAAEWVGAEKRERE
ncbi:hypothetical protein DEO72_LG10g2766 [Vigna unguiculata]|uniref:Uncharacterized protein n=1 Tax=Vigna unguiculata TaxID=3917 RepID=A0A4D6NCH3_VIGUN|nr:hypothetical protein DEO72_LG10g2766 [Vigna unguiculata]